MMNCIRTAFVVVLATLWTPGLAHHTGEHQRNGNELFDRLQGLLGSDPAPATDEFLAPEKAFALSVNATAPDTLTVRWEIARGYYLYRDKLKFVVLAPAGVSVADVRLPPGEVKVDQFFGRSEVYYEQALLTVQLAGNADARGTLALEVGYQGCADAGFCYPPLTRQVNVPLPGALAAAPPPAADFSAQSVPDSDASATGELPAPDRFARELGTATAPQALVRALGFGLQLLLTPCVVLLLALPMIGLRAAALQAHSSRMVVFSTVFVLGIVFISSVAGFASGVAAESLVLMLRAPWFVGAVLVLLVVLALARFRVLALPVVMARASRDPDRSERHMLIGALALGGVAAVTAGPCVGELMAGALNYVGQSGDARAGMLVLLGVSIGAGIPAIAIAVGAAMLLRRTGAPTATVDAVIGVLLLGVAIYHATVIVPGWIIMILSACLLLIVAIYMGALETIPSGASGWRRLWKGVGLMALAYGVLLMVGAAAGGRDPLQPLRNLWVADAPVAGTARAERPQ